MTVWFFEAFVFSKKFLFATGGDLQRSTDGQNIDKVPGPKSNEYICTHPTSASQKVTEEEVERRQSQRGHPLRGSSVCQGTCTYEH